MPSPTTTIPRPVFWAAEAQVADATLRELRRTDEQLEITWKDFIRLCESTNLLLT